MTRVRGLHVGVAAAVAAAVALPAALLATPASAAPDRTSSKEAARVDRVKVTLDWFACEVAFNSPGAQCATAKLPLDYDHPKGATTDVAVLRVKARKPKERVGTLFLNPGGPGGSSVEIAAEASLFLSPVLLDRFDIVGIDPRGIGYGSQVRCWRNTDDQARDLRDLFAVPFPVTTAEQTAVIHSAKAFGRACSTTGKPLAGAMSTAEVARDMDVIRRTLGDKRLNFLGFSYGTQLGQVYANLFPDRVRSVVIDGVLDPVAWVGTPKTRNVPQTIRLKSGEGADRALRAVLDRCRTAGPQYCRLAGLGDPQQLTDELAATVRKTPIEIVDPADPNNRIVVTYAMLYSLILNRLYATVGAGEAVDDILYSVLTAGAKSATPTQRATAIKVLRRVEAKIAADRKVNAVTAAGQKAFRGYEFPYQNFEAFNAVLCTDGRNPARAEAWPAAMAKADKAAPGFGPAWGWGSVPCAEKTWTVRDEDWYAGPFTRKTVSPVLVVGNFYDPATAYTGAQAAARLLPNSRLISSDSYGHTAYGTSSCLTNAVDRYLLSGRLPATGTLCVGPQPFQKPLPGGPGAARSSASVSTDSGARPAPIRPFVPTAPN